MRQKIKIMWLGLRGFPNIQGGVEMHGEKLCPLLAELGCDMHVIVRTPYQPRDCGDTWHQVRFHHLWAPRSKSLEAIVHSALGVLYAGLINRPDVLHIQAIGPALVTPLARLLGLKVVVTHHGPDYERQKWGRLGKLSLELGERLGMLWSNARIVISEGIASAVRTKYGLESTLIPNGATLPDRPDATDCIDTFGLEPGKYVLLVSRLVPEKRHLDLIEAFQQAAVPGWKLALVGSSDHPDDYTRAVLAAAEATPNVVRLYRLSERRSAHAALHPRGAFRAALLA
jgi:glycosyltransferase involved in cell wall biosynthesis